MSYVKEMLKITLYAVVGLAILRLIPGVKDLVKTYVTGA